MHGFCFLWVGLNWQCHGSLLKYRKDCMWLAKGNMNIFPTQNVGVFVKIVSKKNHHAFDWISRAYCQTFFLPMCPNISLKIITTTPVGFVLFDWRIRLKQLFNILLKILTLSPCIVNNEALPSSNVHISSFNREMGGGQKLKKQGSPEEHISAKMLTCNTESALWVAT